MDVGLAGLAINPTNEGWWTKDGKGSLKNLHLSDVPKNSDRRGGGGILKLKRFKAGEIFTGNCYLIFNIFFLNDFI